MHLSCGLKFNHCKCPVFSSTQVSNHHNMHVVILMKELTFPQACDWKVSPQLMYSGSTSWGVSQILCLTLSIIRDTFDLWYFGNWLYSHLQMAGCTFYSGSILGICWLSKSLWQWLVYYRNMLDIHIVSCLQLKMGVEQTPEMSYIKFILDSVQCLAHYSYTQSTIVTKL
jgi:hypothetical protein